MGFFENRAQRARLARGELHRFRLILHGQQEGDRLAHQHASSHDHGVRASQRDARLVEQPHHPERRTRPHARLAGKEPALVHGVQPVHVLARRQRFDHLLGVEAPGQGQLDEDAMHVGAVGELTHEGEELSLGGRRRESVAERPESDFPAGPFLVADVEARGRVLAHENGGEPRDDTPRGEPGDAVAHLVPHRHRHRLAVDGLSQGRDPGPATFYRKRRGIGNSRAESIMSATMLHSRS